MSRLDPPQRYDDTRRSIWADTVARLTESGRVFRADPHLLDAYVEAVASHRQASQLLSQSHVLIQRGDRAVENPALGVQMRAAEAMSRASKALGLDHGPLSSMTVPDPLPPGDGKCGAKKKQGPGTCTQRAGWGTPHPGTGRCKLHGGCAPSSVAAGLEARARRLLYEQGAEPVANPLEALQALAGRALALELAIGEQVNELRHIRYESEGGGEQLRGELLVMERAMDRCGRLLTDIAKLGIEEKLAGIRQKTADMLERAFDMALEASGAGVEGQARARETFARNLKVVA